MMEKAMPSHHYPCRLYGLTSASSQQKKEWKDFVKKLDLHSEFMHRDEFMKKYNIPNAEFPAAYMQTGTTVTLFITSMEINECGTLADLKRLVNKSLPEVLGESKDY